MYIRQIYERKDLELTPGDLTVAEKSERTARSNLHSDMQLNCQKSADAIVPTKIGKGRTLIVSNLRKDCK